MRVLIVDNHAAVRAALSAMLEQFPGIDIVGEAEDGKLAVEMARELHPDVVLMDVHLPVLDGIEATRLICTESPNVRVIGMSMYDQVERAQPMLDAGAVAYVSKSESSNVLLQAIRRCGYSGRDRTKAGTAIR